MRRVSLPAYAPTTPGIVRKAYITNSTGHKLCDVGHRNTSSTVSSGKTLTVASPMSHPGNRLIAPTRAAKANRNDSDVQERFSRPFLIAGINASPVLQSAGGFIRTGRATAITPKAAAVNKVIT